MFRHPSYYKKLRERNKSDRAISSQKTVDVARQRAPWSGPQAASYKQQASSFKLQAPRATSHKRQAPSIKVQASSPKRQAP